MVNSLLFHLINRFTNSFCTFSTSLYFSAKGFEASKIFAVTATPATPVLKNLFIVCCDIPVISEIFFFLVTILANIFASEQKSELINHDNAIIMAPSVTVKSTPNQSGTDLFILHEGRKVIIKDNTMKEWKEIKLEDGNVGWVPTNVIEII